MNINEFINTYKPNLSEYCSVVIDATGEVHICTNGHLSKLIELSGDAGILKMIPAHLSPLYYLTDMLKCVIVDYENQIYSGEMTEQQIEVINRLEAVHLIKKNCLNIGNKQEL